MGSRNVVYWWYILPLWATDQLMQPEISVAMRTPGEDLFAGTRGRIKPSNHLKMTG